MKEIERARIIEDYFRRERRQYVIPVYQRNYEWSQKECIKLFDDIKMAAKRQKTHFCGSIVCAPLKTDYTEIDSFVVIDGQQRLTTIYLLLIALNNVAQKYLGTEFSLQSSLVNTKQFGKIVLDRAIKLKLKPVKGDNNQLLLLIDKKYDNLDHSSGILRNYELFCRLIEAEKDIATGSEHNVFSEIYEGLSQLLCAKITLDDDDNAQEIFDRINSTGIPLSLSDKIRNFVLMTDANQETLYEKYWLQIENLIPKEHTTAFFLTYLNFKAEGFPKDEVAYDTFKSLYESDNYTNEVMLQELCHYAKFYNSFLYGNAEYSDNVNGHLYSLKELKQTTLFIFLFKLFDDYEHEIIDNDILEKVLQFLLSYSVRRIACEVGSNSLRGLYKTLYARVFSDEENKKHYYDAIVSFLEQLNSKDAIPTDEEFRNALVEKNIYNKKVLCKFLLLSIENNGKEKIVTDNLTIEHVMPQDKKRSLSLTWQKMLGDSWEIDHIKYLHTLGNLTLTAYNSELGDQSFEKKKELLSEVHTKIVRLNKSIISSSSWNVESIKKRANELASIIIEQFPIFFPQNKILFTSPGYYEYYCDTPENATGKYLNYYEFMGERVMCSAFSDMLKWIIERLYEIDSTIIENLAKNNECMEGSSIPMFTYEADLVPKDIKVGKTEIYECSGFSSERIIRIIRWLLDKYDIDHSDFIYSAKASKNVQIE